MMLRPKIPPFRERGECLALLYNLSVRTRARGYFFFGVGGFRPARLLFSPALKGRGEVPSGVDGVKGNTSALRAPLTPPPPAGR